MLKLKNKNEKIINQVKGTFTLLVVLSSAYAIATIMLGTGSETLPKILVSPLAVWSLLELLKRFTK